MSFFDITNNLTQSNDYIYSGEMNDYLPFMINRSISQHYDTCMHANEMNCRSGLSNRVQYDYYHHAIQPKKKRFAKWAKPEVDENIELVAEFYSCSINTAEQYMVLLDENAMEHIKEKLSRGGRK